MTKPRAALTWRERAAELLEAELAALDAVLERVADAELLFTFRGDTAARSELRQLAAYIRARAGDIRAERDALDLLDGSLDRARLEWQDTTTPAK